MLHDLHLISNPGMAKTAGLRLASQGSANWHADPDKYIILDSG